MSSSSSLTPFVKQKKKMISSIPFESIPVYGQFMTKIEKSSIDKVICREANSNSNESKSEEGSALDPLGMLMQDMLSIPTPNVNSSSSNNNKSLGSTNSKILYDSNSKEMSPRKRSRYAIGAESTSKNINSVFKRRSEPDKCAYKVGKEHKISSHSKIQNNDTGDSVLSVKLEAERENLNTALDDAMERCVHCKEGQLVRLYTSFDNTSRKNEIWGSSCDDHEDMLMRYVDPYGINSTSSETIDNSKSHLKQMKCRKCHYIQ